MRISDWSSDVCSSDLARDRRRAVRHPRLYADQGNVQLRLGARTLRRRTAQRPVAAAPAPARPRPPPPDGNLSEAPPTASPAHDYAPAGALTLGQVAPAHLLVRPLAAPRLARSERGCGGKGWRC